MKKFVLAPALAALAMFLWGFLYYGLSGIPYRPLGHTVADVGPALNALFPSDGTYLIPDPKGSPEIKAEQMKRGQFAMVHIRKSGIAAMDPLLLAKGYALEFLCCALLMLLRHKTQAAVRDFSCTVKFSLMIGLIATVFSNGGEIIWWHQDFAWHAMTMIHDGVAWLLAGIVLAFFVKPIPANNPQR